MLHKNAVPPAALDLLKELSAIDQLNSFALGGGTNLALRKGHRLSVDLDFFTNISFDTEAIFMLITKKYPSSELLYQKNQTILFTINDIKVDFVLYPFPWLNTFDILEESRLLSVEDIIPMKLQAVSNRNAKKDYWDIHALLAEYPLKEMLKLFSSKFPQIDTGFIIHSLTDFEKADMEPDPDSNLSVTWTAIKENLSAEVRNYTQSFL